MGAPIPGILEGLRLDGLVRIDAALEGDWNPTVRTVWTRDAGRRTPDEPLPSHPSFKPSLELYFDDHWVGIHCYRCIDGRNVFDGELAQAVIGFIEAKLRVPSD
jgi:hypothetical protein